VTSDYYDELDDLMNATRDDDDDPRDRDLSDEKWLIDPTGSEVKMWIQALARRVGNLHTDLARYDERQKGIARDVEDIRRKLDKSNDDEVKRLDARYVTREQYNIDVPPMKRVFWIVVSAFATLIVGGIWVSLMLATFIKNLQTIPHP